MILLGSYPIAGIPNFEARYELYSLSGVFVRSGLDHTKQANVSRMERRTDMYISTLRSYIEAMGGELDIVARFPDGEVHINQFEDIDSDDKRDAARV